MLKEISKKRFNIRHSFKLISEHTSDFNLWLAEPQTDQSQRIGRFIISKKPNSTYSDSFGNKIHYFKFKNLNALEITIKYPAILSKIKTKLVLKSKSKTLINNQFLRSDKFIEQTSDVKKLTRSLIKGKKNDLEKIVSISQFIKTNFKYKYPVPKRGVKNLRLNNLRGDCGEAGCLFVAMCRIAGIPAINHTGFVVYHDDLKNIYEHGWASIHLNGTGWVQIDPRAKNIKKMGKDFYYSQDNYFLTIVRGLNIPLKPKIPSNYKLDYWLDLGLPMTHNHAQILQPLIFTSSSKIKFQEEVSLN